MKDRSEILTLCENQSCILYRSTVTCNLNSHSCCMLFNRALMQVNLKLKKLVYILGFSLNEIPIDI